MNQGQAIPTSRAASDKPLRVAIIVSKETISEFSASLRYLLLGMADESIRTALICPADSNVENIISLGVEIIVHPVFNLPFLGRINNRMLTEKLQDFKPTVLHCLSPNLTSVTRKLAKQFSLPYVLTFNSLQRRPRGLRFSSKRLAKVITPAESIVDNFSKAYPRLTERVAHINHGSFVPETSSCFSEPGRIVSMVVDGRDLDHVDDFECLFNAVRHLAIDDHEFMLFVVEPGPSETHLRKLLKAQGLSQIVTIIAHKEPWRYVLAESDIFIAPVPSDTFSPLLLEAMSVGAAVAGCKGGVDDLIIEGQTAAIFDPDDELSIYSCLQKLLDDRQAAKKMAQNAQQHIKENYSVSRMVETTLRIYRESSNFLKQ